jgi:signal transduction histidine kinase
MRGLRRGLSNRLCEEEGGKPMDKKIATLRTTSAQPNPDLETVLAEWHSTTLRLEQTHETLREDVRRLTEQLEAKNREPDCHDHPTDLGQAACQVASQLRNHLVPITLNLSLLRRRVADDPIALNILEKLDAGFTAVDATVQDLSRFITTHTPQWRSFSLGKLIDDVLDSLAPRLAAQSIETVVDVPKDQSVRADREMIQQALVNLLLNAIDTMPDGGTLTVTSAASEQGLELEVGDTGPGLPEDTRRHVFEPFFTTKSGGTGLGLAVVHRIVEAHGGYVTAVNCPEGGAAFTLSLPRRARKAAA